LNDYADITIFPNPAREKIYLELPRNLQEGMLVVYSIDGKKLITRQIKDKNIEIDIKTLPVGIYLVEVVNNLGTIFKKIIKE